MARKRSRRKKFSGFKRRYDKNQYIRAEKLRVIDDAGENLGEMSRGEALKQAEEKDLDLVLISPNENPPVAKIVDWAKFKYEQNKKAKGSSRKASEVKEWRFFAKTEKHDINNKLKNAQKFLEKGGKAKFLIRYKRRDRMEELYAAMDRIFEVAGDSVEKISDVTREGRNLSVFVKKATGSETEEPVAADTDNTQPDKAKDKKDGKKKKD